MSVEHCETCACQERPDAPRLFAATAATLGGCSMCFRAGGHMTPLGPATHFVLLVSGNTGHSIRLCELCHAEIAAAKVSP